MKTISLSKKSVGAADALSDLYKAGREGPWLHPTRPPRNCGAGAQPPSRCKSILGSGSVQREFGRHLFHELNDGLKPGAMGRDYEIRF
jgi:hypothetical protein